MKEAKFQFALVQHPMLLLIHEDRGEPTIGERIPPWGAPDVGTYADRIRHNLEALQRYPDLKLNYEFSGLELEILAENAPDIILIMREMVKLGRLAFVGGDYSQPHGHLFSGELNFRQIQHGLSVIRDLVGYVVQNNFHQETCLHDQLPQLLRAFGFQTASPPTFTHNITPVSPADQPELVKSAEAGYVPMAADSVASWRGLDGTEIPVVILGISRGSVLDPRLVRQEAYKGLYHSSRIILAAPDMAEIDLERHEFIHRMGESVLLDRALNAAVENQAPTWQVRLHSYWSYAEGEWAEAVYRQIRRAETMLLAEEAQATLRSAEPRQGFVSDLRTALAAMHHDVHWMEVTDLKQKYISRLEEAEQRSRAEVTRLVGGTANEQPISEGFVKVVNTLPYEREEIVGLRISETVRVMQTDGMAVPSLCLPSRDGPCQVDLLFAARVPASGETTYRIQADHTRTAMEVSCAEATVFAGKHEYTIGADGTISAALVNSRNILAGPGHDLHYLAPDGKRIGGPGRSGTMVRFRSDLGDVLHVTAPIGDIFAEIRFIASPMNPYLMITTHFIFNGHQIGTMWEDWTKLNAYWPVAGRSIRHGIPYGSIDGREGVPLYAPHWLSVQGPAGGLALFNTGTPKHFVEQGIIGNILAWGGRVFTNRTNTDWEKCHNYDLTLKGTHTIRSGAMVFAPGASEVQLTRAAQCLNSPMLVCASKGADGGKPQVWTLDLGGTGLIGTAILTMGGRPVCRFFEPAGKLHSAKDIQAAIGADVQVSDLTGRILDRVDPYRIGYLTLCAAEGGKSNNRYRL